MNDSEHKYDVANPRLIDDDVGLTDHSLYRWKHRTPHDCPISIQQGWRRGEDIQHPQLCKIKKEPAPTRVRLYRHSSEWGVAFICSQDLSEFASSEVVLTVLDISRFSHGPTAAYFRAHDIHGPGETDA